VHLGDSIAVNGTCLTVTEFSQDSFKVGVAPETLRRTNLGLLKEGMGVNLERAVAGHVRFGGHFVQVGYGRAPRARAGRDGGANGWEHQGHVDTTAEIISKTPDGNALTIRFRPNDPSVLTYIVEKGYITLDGASLTIVAVNDKEQWFEVMLVAYTQEKIVIPRKQVGDSVNVEVDMAGKYIEKQVKAHLEKGLAAEGGVLERMVRDAVEKALAKK
jgi:riboflavin synthase